MPAPRRDILDVERRRPAAGALFNLLEMRADRPPIRLTGLEAEMRPRDLGQILDVVACG